MKRGREIQKENKDNKKKTKKNVQEKVFETRTKTEAASSGLPQAVINYVVVAQREGDGRTGPHETPSTLSAAAAQWCFVVYCATTGADELWEPRPRLPRCASPDIAAAATLLNNDNNRR